MISVKRVSVLRGMNMFTREAALSISFLPIGSEGKEVPPKAQIILFFKAHPFLEGTYCNVEQIESFKNCIIRRNVSQYLVYICNIKVNYMYKAAARCNCALFHLSICP